MLQVSCRIICPLKASTGSHQLAPLRAFPSRGRGWEQCRAVSPRGRSGDLEGDCPAPVARPCLQRAPLYFQAHQGCLGFLGLPPTWLCCPPKPCHPRSVPSVCSFLSKLLPVLAEGASGHCGVARSPSGFRFRHEGGNHSWRLGVQAAAGAPMRGAQGGLRATASPCRLT